MILHMYFLHQEEPLFNALVQKKFLTALNDSLRDHGRPVIGKDELAVKKAAP